MTDKQKLQKAIEILQDINIDAKMALCDDWDRGDDGFDAQSQIIEEFFKEIGVEPKEYKPEEE